MPRTNIILGFIAVGGFILLIQYIALGGHSQYRVPGDKEAVLAHHLKRAPKNFTSNVDKRNKELVERMREESKAKIDPLQYAVPPPILRAEIRPRILCWVMTDTELLNKTKGVKDTWTRRCDVRLFISSEADKGFPTIKVDVPKGRNHTAIKAKKAWTYVYKNHFNDADFFMKADPDTYVIVENLKKYLQVRNASEPEFYGHRFSPKFLNHTYMSGGPGYVLSREALRRLVTKGYTSSPPCFKLGQGEDYKTAACLIRAGARPVDTRDEEGRETFLVFNPKYLLTGINYDWYKEYDTNGAVTGDKCCSKTPISFHYMGGQDMYFVEFLFYRANRPLVSAQQSRPFSFYNKHKHRRPLHEVST